LNLSIISPTKLDTLESNLLCIFRGFDEESKSSKLDLLFKTNYLKSGIKINVFVIHITPNYLSNHDLMRIPYMFMFV